MPFVPSSFYWACFQEHPCCSIIVAVHSLSHVRFFAIPWTAAHQASLSFTISWSLLKLTSIGSWCHPTIFLSVVPFSSWPQSFPASGSFPMSQLFASGGQSIGASALALVLPVNIQDCFPWGLTGLISLLSKGPSRVWGTKASQFKSISSLVLSLFYGPIFTSMYDYWKNHSFY